MHQVIPPQLQSFVLLLAELHKAAVYPGGTFIQESLGRSSVFLYLSRAPGLVPSPVCGGYVQCHFPGHLQRH